MDLKNKNFLDCQNCNNSSFLIKYLSDAQKSLFSSGKNTVHFFDGELIQKTGTVSSHIVYLKSGFAKLYLEDSKHKDLTVKIIRPCEFYISPGIFTDNKYHFSLKAMGNCQICFIEEEVIKEILQNNAKFSFEYFKNLNSFLLEIVNKLHSMATKQNTGKLAETISLISKEIYCESGPRLKLSINDIAELTGISRDSAKKLLKSFEEEKLLEFENGDLKILDAEKLEQIATKG
ncbi:MAG: hypothetical protein C0598_10900 [Marinilabiliales bacterium]|nr:MAG: hypothetical protein C0598_10900 [Marinilabiliales bacterium]